MEKPPVSFRVLKAIQRKTGFTRRYELLERGTRRYLGTWFALCGAEAWHDAAMHLDLKPCERSDFIVRRV